MSFQSPANRILRRTVEGMEGMHSKFFDPPTANPPTPDLVSPTNPVPEVMAAAGFLDRNPPSPLHTVQRQLMHGMTLPTWDGQNMQFFLFRDPDGIGAARDGSFPAPTVRMPRGAIFHGATQGSGPPPHTIHWHGMEPTPVNDGVGHCSMELGRYTYQWQPNFIGSYFYHCHRNTVQHFEFGLYGFMIFDPPDAFFASIASTNPDGSVNLNAIPIGNGRPEPGFPLGRRRIQANLAAFPQFGQDNFSALDTPDPLGQYPADPHAYTVPYDVEALWVFDDRDINWSNLAKNSRATFPAEGTIPGVNDNFFGNAGVPLLPGDFFAFNDFRSTHFYVTGVNVPDESGTLRIPGAGQLPAGIVIPPELMSGVSGVQVSINARANQNILLRMLNAAYNNVRVTFPVDIVIIAWDGRALGVPPYGKYNSPVLVPAGTTMEWSVARRFDCMIRSATPVDGVATVEFIDTLRHDRRFTARIPISIQEAPAGNFVVSGNVTSGGAPLAGVTMTLSGTATATALTDAAGNYSFPGLADGAYTVAPSRAGFTFAPPSTALTVSGADVTGVNFVGTPVAATFPISGNVTSGGTPLAGVTMTLSGAAAATALTDAAGNYSFAGLANGNYTVTPSLAGFAFTPLNRAVTLNGAAVTGQDFVATPAATFTVSGTVRRRGFGAAPGSPIAGATIALSGAGNATVLTDANGNYALAGLSNGNYIVTPSLAGFAFTPLNRAVSVNGANVAGQDFIGTEGVITFVVSGNVTSGGTPLAGVTMTLSGAAAATALTDAAGNYSFAGLADGNYTLTPSLGGFTFTPPSRNVTVNGANVTGQNFAGTAVGTTFSLSGTVTGRGFGAGASVPVAGVTMTLSGAASATALTDAAGNYSFGGLANGSYTVTPSQPGRTFTPVSRAVTISNSDVSGQNFTRL